MQDIQISCCWNIKIFCSIAHHAWVSYIIILMVQHLKNCFQICI